MYTFSILALISNSNIGMNRIIIQTAVLVIILVLKI